LSRPKVAYVSVPGSAFTGNAYFPLLVDGLRQVGAEVVDATVLNLLRKRVTLLIHFPDHCVTEVKFRRCLVRTIQHLSLYAFVLLRGGKIVWFVHDVQPFRQRRRWVLSPYMWLFRKIIHARVFLSRTSQRQFHVDFPHARDVPELLVYHGPYRTYSQPEDGHAFRRRLKVTSEDKLVGFLGSLKNYKNLGALAGLPETAGGRKVSILVAGKSEEQSRGDLLTLENRLGDRLKCFDVHLSDLDFEHAIRACDVVVIPYSNGYNSGVALHALSCGTPILTSRLPIFTELREDFGQAWVRICPTAGDMGRELENLLESMPRQGDREALHSILKDRSFSKAGAALVAFTSRIHGLVLSLTVACAFC
jgi:glycosyltransferase involved in cell wall biosynthesis